MRSKNIVKVDVLQQMKSGEKVCGDSYFHIETPDQFICALADGLGSGIYARESSQTVIDTIKDNYHLTEEVLIKKCVQSLADKRGVVLGILKLDFITQQFTYSSIGNIQLITKKINEEKKIYIPKRGHLSQYKRPLKKVTGELTPQKLFILYSDGIMQADLFRPNHPFKQSQWLTPLPDRVKSEDDVTVITMQYQGRNG